MSIAILSEIKWLEPDDFYLWRCRLDQERLVRNLTPARQLALQKLLSFHGPEGLYPSDATVAAEAGVSVSTVQRARRDAKELGLLDWKPTRKLVNGRMVQGSNQYSLKMPAGKPVSRRISPDSQPDRQSQDKKVRERPIKAGPSSGSDEWARWNAQRQIAALLGMQRAA